MKTKGKTLNEKHLEQARAGKPVGLYTAPQVEVIDIELTQNFLGSANTNFLPYFDDGEEAW